MTTTAKAIGHRIARERMKQGFSQQELADKAKVTRAYVSMLEAGTNVPSVGTLQRLATALDTTTSYLIEGEAA